VDVPLSKYPVKGRKIVTVRPEAWRGIRVDYPSGFVDADQPARSGLAFFDDGVVVTDVEEKTPAAEAGLKRGMIVSHVDRTPVRTPQDFERAVAGRAGPVQLRLVQGEPGAVVTVPGS
jgi:S1-C subfamily serine protease